MPAEMAFLCASDSGTPLWAAEMAFLCALDFGLVGLPFLPAEMAFLCASYPHSLLPHHSPRAHGSTVRAKHSKPEFSNSFIPAWLSAWCGLLRPSQLDSGPTGVLARQSYRYTAAGRTGGSRVGLPLPPKVEGRSPCGRLGAFSVTHLQGLLEPFRAPQSASERFRALQSASEPSRALQSPSEAFADAPEAKRL